MPLDPVILAKYTKRQKTTRISAKTKKDKQQDKAIAKLKNVIQSNIKYVQGVLGETAVVNASPVLSLLNGIAQGDTNLTREATKVNWRNMTIRIQLFTDASWVVTDMVRVMIVRETTALGSAVGMSQLMQSSTPVAVHGRNITTRDPRRFKILYDKAFTMGTPAQGVGLLNGNNPSDRFITLKKKLGFTTSYDRGSDATISSIEINSLYLIVFTDATTADSLYVNAGWTLEGYDI
nr:capsid protein [Cressdnaviricota sp.]UOF79568.1 capsid protein [Cressdnaviricota sp.]